MRGSLQKLSEASTGHFVITSFWVDDGFGVTEATHFVFLYESKLVEHWVFKLDEDSLKLVWLRREIYRNGLQPDAYELVEVGRVRGIDEGCGMIDSSPVISWMASRADVSVAVLPPSHVQFERAL